MYAPTGVSEFSVKEAFYAQLHMASDSCSEWDILIVLGDFNATTGTEKMAMSHVLGLTALDQKGKLLNAPRLREKSKAEDSWILVAEAGIAPLEFVLQ